MEFASIFFVRQVMLNAARDAARSYSIGDLSAQEARQRSLDLLPNSMFTASASSASSESLDRWIEVRIPVKDAAIGDPLNVLGSSNLTVRVTMRRED